MVFRLVLNKEKKFSLSYYRIVERFLKVGHCDPPAILYSCLVFEAQKILFLKKKKKIVRVHFQAIND